MTLPRYFADAAAAMQLQSQAIRRDFASHRPSAGENREGVLARFLREHLPGSFGIETGLVVASSGQFSNQADLVVTDATRNAALYSTSPEKVILAESVYALIEVKTNLTPAEISDSISRCRRFKSLPRQYLQLPFPAPGPFIRDSLFVLFAYDSPSGPTLKRNLLEALAGEPQAEQPDFIVVLGKYVSRGGAYLELSTIGQEGSSFRQALVQQTGGDPSQLRSSPIDLGDYQENALFAWFVWFQSWLQQAGPRQANILAYLPPDMVFGQCVV